MTETKTRANDRVVGYTERKPEMMGGGPVFIQQEGGKPQQCFTYTTYGGLTKRELFAAMAMQGLLSDHIILNAITSIDQKTPDIAVKYADALIEALNKGGGE